MAFNAPTTLQRNTRKTKSILSFLMMFAKHHQSLEDFLAAALDLDAHTAFWLPDRLPNYLVFCIRFFPSLYNYILIL